MQYSIIIDVSKTAFCIHKIELVTLTQSFYNIIPRLAVVIS
jgi:hypothetical protein